MSNTTTAGALERIAPYYESVRKAYAKLPRWTSTNARENARYGIHNKNIQYATSNAHAAPNVTELLCWLTEQCPGAYLEIGVSVGRNFYAVCECSKAPVTIGLDLSPPSAALKQALLPNAPAREGNIYHLDGAHHWYVVCDSTSDAAKRALNTLVEREATSVQVAFLDGNHSAAGVRSDCSLVSSVMDMTKPFAIVFDDLGNYYLKRNYYTAARNEFHTFARSLQERYGKALRAQTFYIDGWSKAHLMGIITNVNMETLPSAPVDAATLLREE